MTETRKQELRAAAALRMARVPRADMVKVAAYEASERARVDTWLTFEADYQEWLANPER